jgi:hypothetical protein
MTDLGLTDGGDCNICGFLKNLLAAGLAGAVKRWWDS